MVGVSESQTEVSPCLRYEVWYGRINRMIDRRAIREKGGRRTERRRMNNAEMHRSVYTLNLDNK